MMVVRDKEDGPGDLVLDLGGIVKEVYGTELDGPQQIVAEDQDAGIDPTIVPSPSNPNCQPSFHQRSLW